MTKKERFGKFVLLAETEVISLGSEYRAAKLGPTGLEKIVSILKLSPALSANADAAKLLMDQAKFAAQLQNPSIAKIFGIGKVEGSYYISYEFIEGKSLRAIFNRCRQEGFPFSVDHTLLIASKICSALEYAHSRKVEGAARYNHGLLTPANVVVSYEGEVRLRGFGYWSGRLRETGLLTDEESRYLMPEQVTTGTSDVRSDIYSVGAILFEALTGQPLVEPGQPTDIAKLIVRTRLHGGGDDESLPKPIADILLKALTNDLGHRYTEVQEMRKAIDTLLFSGDFTPTTFNLAFFMHSLFREDIEQETKQLKDDRESNYFDFLADDSARSAAAARTPIPASVSFTPQPVPVEAMPSAPPPIVPPPIVPPPIVPPPIVPPPAPPVAAKPAAPVAPPLVQPLPLIPPPPRTDGKAALPLVPPPPKPVPQPVHTPAPKPVHAPPVVTDAAHPTVSDHEAAAGFTFHKEEARKGSKMPIVALAAVVVLAIVIGAAYFFMSKSPAVPASATPPPNAEAEKLRQDLDAAKARLAEMEAKQKEEADRIAKEAADKAQKAASQAGKQLTPEELKKIQDKARQEQEQRNQAERERLEAEAAAAAEAAAKAASDAAAKAAADAAAKAAADAAAKATPEPAATPAFSLSTVYSADAAGVTAPTRQCGPQDYPQAARIMKIQGTVPLLITIDENGRALEIKTLSGNSILREASVEYFKKCRWVPGKKNGVNAKVQFTTQLVYSLTGR